VRIRILHVDDDRDFLLIAKRYLTSKSPDFELVTTTSPFEALRLVKDEQFDIIISDYCMPEMDGVKLFEELRVSGNDIPFILFAGKKINEITLATLNLGAEYCLLKEGDLETQYSELAHLIQKAILRKRNEKLLQQGTPTRDSNKGREFLQTS
jgi:CheY-like chemotaxis protein